MADAKKSKIYNNPGNIEVGQGYAGETGTYANDRERPFAIFDTPQMGVRALTRDLITKIKRFDGDVDAIINQYAPNNENDTKAYQKFIKQQIGNKSKVDESDLPSLITGIIKKENKGSTADYYLKDPKIIEEGIALSSKSFPSNYTYRDALLEYLTPLPIETRQEGGPVNAGQPYLVGEEGPELVVPNQDAFVLPTNSPETQAVLDELSAGVSSDVADARALGQSLRGSSQSITDMVPQRSPTRDKVKYIKFDDPNAPRIAVPEEFDQEQIKEYLKSESVEAQMYDRGYLYKYGLQPSYYQDNSNLDDWALTAGIKSGYDNLKAIGTGALYTVADTFGSEENMAKFEKLREQYNQDASVHIYKEGEGPGGVESRITSIEDALQSEAKLSAFIDWAAFNTGAGATTMIPIIMASAVGAGVGALTVGAGTAGASIAGMMAAYSMGVGEATGAQLDRSGDANAALSLAAGIPYAAAERYLGTSMMLTRLFKEKYGGEVVKKLVKDTTIKSLSEKKIKNSIIKEVAKGFGKQFVGEGATEAIQESITSTAAEINEGASLAELYSSKDFWKQLGEAAAAGAVAGGTIGGVVGGPIQYIRKAGNKNIDATAALSDKVDTDNTEAINATGGEVGDTFIYTGQVNDTEDKTENATPKEYVLLGTTVTTKGDEVYILTPRGGGAPVLVPLNESSKLTKSQLNEKDVAALEDQQYLPEENTVIPKTKEVNQAVKDLKARGIVNSEQSVEDLVGLPPLNDWLAEELEEYQFEIDNQGRIQKEEGEVSPLPAKYKQYKGLEGDAFNKVAEKQYQKERKQGIVGFYNTTLASENQLTDQEKLELQKLGYYKGPRGIEFINRKLANTKLKDKAKETTGLQEIREIISNQIPHTPQIVESNRVVSRTQVPPLIPRSFDETQAGLDPDSAIELERLTQAKKLNAWQLAKSDEVIEQLKSELETLDPNSPNIEAETTRIQNEINFIESRKQAVAKEISDPLTRILKIREITTHMNNSGFRVNMIQYYRQLLKQARKDRDEAQVLTLRNLIKNYKPTNQHVFEFNNILVYLFTTKAKQQLEFDARQLENNIKDILPTGFTRAAYKALTENQRVLYKQYSRDLQKRLNAIKTIDSKRAELNNLLESFDIEPVVNWNKQKGKISIPAFNKLSKELLGYEKVEREKVIEEYWSLANHPDSLDRPALSQDAIDKMPMILEDLRAELDRLGVNNLDLRIYNSITNKKGAQVNGRFLGGLGLVEVAMNATQNVNGSKLNPADSRMFTLHHESMHYIFKNLLTPEEQVTLKSAARTAYIKRYNIRKRYEGFDLNEEALLEESISDAFAEYMATTSNGSLYSPKGMIASIFNRIRNYIIALGNALSNNQLRSTAQIFNNIDKGVMQARRDIMNKVDISRTEMINLAKIGKISIEQAEKFFNQRGRSVVLVGGERVGSVITNKQLYRSFVIKVLPKFYAVRQDPTTNKIVTAISNLFESLTTESGVINLEQANFYLQQLNSLTDQELNTAAAYLENNQEAISEVTSAALLKSNIESLAGRSTLALFDLINAPNLFDMRIKMLNRQMPTETDIRIAGSPLIVHHSTDKSKTNIITKEGFKAGLDSMGIHFGTKEQAIIRAKNIVSSPVADNMKVFDAVLHIRNPVRMQDMGAYWTAEQTLEALTAAANNPTEQYGMDIDVSRQMAPAMLTDIIFTPTEGGVIRRKMQAVGDSFVGSRRVNASRKRQEILQDAIKAKGYDGIVYRNQYEVTTDYNGDGGAIESLDSYIVFDADQVLLVENNPNLDMSDINYSASSEGSYQTDPSDDKISQPDSKENRPATKEANNGMDDGGKAEDKVLAGTTDDPEVSTKDISKVSKFMMHARGLAARFPVISTMFRAVQGLEQKGRSLQTQFTAQMRNYFDVINRMEGAKEILAKAHIISQQAGAQARYRKDAEGRIVFVSPKNITTGGNNPITILQGEVVVLDGALADVYEDSQIAIISILEEVKKGTIASTFVPQLKQAVEILSRMNPEVLAEALPELIDSNGNIDIKIFNGNVVENLQYGQLVAIINGLARAPQLLRDRAMSASMNNPNDLSNMVETLAEDSEIINGLIGTDATNLPALLQELRNFEELKQFDYVPLQRYGTHAITVKDDETGEVIRYEHISIPLTEEKATGMTTSRRFNEVRSRLLAEYPASQGYTVSEVEEISENFRSKMPKDLSMIDSMAQHLSDKNAKRYDKVRSELDTIIGKQNVVGFDKFVRGRRMIGGVPGFDGDILRSISQFGMIASEYGARNRYLKDVNNSYSDAINFTDINNMPNLREAVEKMKAYGVDNMHSHEWTMPRRLGFWWFLGGNLSSGILQTMSMVQFTGPMLAQFANSAKSATQLSRAFVEVNRLLSFTDNQFGDVFLNLDRSRLLEIFKDEALVDAVLEDIANGIIKQGQALYESGQAPGFTLTPTDKTNMRIRGRIKQLEQGVMGGTFNTYETISRMTAYVAAYRLAQDPKTMQNADTWYSGSNFIWNEMKKQRGGIANAQDFARILIDDTFGDYSKINRPMIMRGAGSIFFLFQTYISQMFGLLRRLLVGQGNAQSTAMGRKMFARIMLLLFLTGGLMGLPGADDLDFLYRMTRKMGGVDEDLRTVMREALVDLTGPKMTEAIMNGGIEAFGNVNVQRRLSLGEVPGSGQARALITALGFPTGAKAEEFLGAPGAVFFQSGREIVDIFSREGKGALADMDLYMAAAPTFIKNAYRAAYKYPQQGYVDTRRGTLITADLNGFDLLMQGIGFTPTKISKARNVLYYERQVDSKYQGTTKKFNAQIKNAFRDMYIGYNLTSNKAMADAAQLKILEIMREIQKFNNNVDSNYTYVPDISRLRKEGILQANFNLRALKSNKKTFKGKQELKDQFGVTMN